LLAGRFCLASAGTFVCFRLLLDKSELFNKQLYSIGKESLAVLDHHQWQIITLDVTYIRAAHAIRPTVRLAGIRVDACDDILLAVTQDFDLRLLAICPNGRSESACQLLERHIRPQRDEPLWWQTNAHMDITAPPKMLSRQHFNRFGRPFMRDVN